MLWMGYKNLYLLYFSASPPVPSGNEPAPSGNECYAANAGRARRECRVRLRGDDKLLSLPQSQDRVNPCLRVESPSVSLIPFFLSAKVSSSL
jgi:hypothetical protein